MANANPFASVQTPQDLVNTSLVRVGYKKHIGNLYDGSMAARTALRIYGQTRDQLLHTNDWGFSERNISATLLKFAPPGGYFPPNAWNPATNPPPPWLYEYTYPQDAIKVRSVRGQPLFVMNFDPQPNTFTTENDNSFTPPQRVVLCNVPSALIVYTGRITDLTAWDEDAVEAFSAALGRRLAPALVGLDAAKLAAADEGQEAQMAMEERPK
jgi:hypothetical protein